MPVIIAEIIAREGKGEMKERMRGAAGGGGGGGGDDGEVDGRGQIQTSALCVNPVVANSAGLSGFFLPRKTKVCSVPSKPSKLPCPILISSGPKLFPTP